MKNVRGNRAEVGILEFKFLSDQKHRKLVVAKSYEKKSDNCRKGLKMGILWNP